MSTSSRFKTSTANALGLEDKDVLRSPPVNFEAEVQLLGSILSNNRAFEKVADFLQPEHFADPRHSRIFEACGKLIGRGQIASPITLKNYFEQDATLTEIGGPAYLTKLAAAAVTIINAGDHGRIVQDLYLRRQLIGIGEDVVNRAYAHDLETSATDQIALGVSALDSLSETGRPEGGPQSIGVGARNAVLAADRALKEGRDGITGISTGLTRINRKLRGLHPGDLIIVGARPGMGKTALGASIAYNVANNYAELPDEGGKLKRAAGGKVLFFSLEMTAEQLAGRLLGAMTGISADRQRGGDFQVSAMQDMVEREAELAQMPFLIDDTPALGISQIRQRARRAKRSHGLDLVVVDYVQLVTTPSQRDYNRAAAIGEVTRGLKTMAKELAIPVIALAQLSRKVEERDNKRPTLADLRESGDIENDADAVIFVYRHEYYLADQKPVKRPNQKPEVHDAEVCQWGDELEKCKGVAEAIFGKNRHGPTGSVRLKFNAELTWFQDLEEAPAGGLF